MNGDLFREFLDRLQPLCPQARIMVEPFGCEELPDVLHFVHFLGVPRDRLAPVRSRAYDLAYDLYGDAALPFCLTVVTPEHAAQEYAGEMGLDGGANRVAGAPGP